MPIADRTIQGLKGITFMTAVVAHSSLGPSPWVQRWSHLVGENARVLDVACGTGRHLRWFAERGAKVTGIDRDAAAVEASTPIAEIVVADIENAPWPLVGRRFDAVVVANYLWRPLLPRIVQSLDVAGVLIYETFATGNQSVGKPSNPQYLLRPGELLNAAQDLRVIAYEDGFLDAPARFVQRLVAVREEQGSTAIRRYALP